jgi:hypothetical protein
MENENGHEVRLVGLEEKREHLVRHGEGGGVHGRGPGRDPVFLGSEKQPGDEAGFSQEQNRLAGSGASPDAQRRVTGSSTRRKADKSSVNSACDRGRGLPPPSEHHLKGREGKR